MIPFPWHSLDPSPNGFGSYFISNVQKIYKYLFLRAMTVEQPRNHKMKLDCPNLSINVIYLPI